MTVKKKQNTSQFKMWQDAIPGSEVSEYLNVSKHDVYCGEMIHSSTLIFKHLCKFPGGPRLHSA